MSGIVDLCGDKSNKSPSFSTQESTDRDIVAIIGTGIIHQLDLRTLSPGFWLYDSIVSSFMTIMNDHDESLFKGAVIQKQSFFSNALLVPLLMEDRDGYNFKKVRKKSRQALGQDIFALHKLYFLVCMQREYWALLMVNICEKNYILRLARQRWMALPALLPAVFARQTSRHPRTRD